MDINIKKEYLEYLKNINNTVNVTRSSMPSYEEYCEEIKDLWDSHWLTNVGIKHIELQEKLENYLNCKHVVLFTNGHLALENAIAAMNFTEGSEIITTPFTFASTTHAIVRNRLKPVFCDIKESDYTIDETKIENLITNKTVAILPVHVYGNICNIEGIEKIAKKHKLRVIYDAAHAFGVKYKDISVANFGDISMFSFHATKVFNTIEGGALCFNDDKYVSILNDLKNFGIHGPESVEYVGGNAKMSEFQAAMGICNLRHLNENVIKRKELYDTYTKYLYNIVGIKLNSVQNNVISNYAYYPIVFDNYKYTRNEVFNLLAKENIITRKYFYPLTSKYECYKKYKQTVNTPIAERVADNVLCLPMFDDLNKEIIKKITEILK